MMGHNNQAWQTSIFSLLDPERSGQENRPSSTNDFNDAQLKILKSIPWNHVPYDLTTEYCSVAWYETDTGHFQRDVDEIELFYISMAKQWEATGQTAFAITGRVDFELVVDANCSAAKSAERVEMAFRRAWEYLRYDHPTLAATTHYDETRGQFVKMYEALNSRKSDAQDEWLRRTFKLIDDGRTGADFCAAGVPVSSMSTLHMVVDPASVEPGAAVLRRSIVFRSRHDVIDGIGTLLLLNNLFAYAAEIYNGSKSQGRPRFGDEWKNLSPSYRVAFRQCPVSTESQRERMQKVVDGNNHMRAHPRILYAPYSLADVVPKRSQQASFHFSRAESTMIVQACKKLNVSVTQAVHAALILMTCDLQNREDQQVEARYNNYCLVNLRQAAKYPYDTNLHAASVYSAAVPGLLTVDVVIPRAGQGSRSDKDLRVEYVRILQQVQRYYTAVQLGPDFLDLLPSFFDAITPPCDSKTFKIPEPNTTPSISLSSLGVVDTMIDSQHGPFSLHDPWVAGDELSTGLGMFLSSWGGEIALRICYNESFHTADAMSDILHKTKEMITRALSVAIQYEC